MPVESADDLAGFFDPDEFGEAMTATMSGVEVEFSGIYTDGPVIEQPGTSVGISGYTPRVIASRGALNDLRQGDTITRLNGQIYYVNETNIKNSLLVIHLHDNW